MSRMSTAAQRVGWRAAVPDAGVVRSEAVEVLHRLLELVVRPGADLVADRPERRAGHPWSMRPIASSRFTCFWMQVLMRPSEQSWRRSRTAFSNSFISASRCASWLGQHAQIAHQAREHAGSVGHSVQGRRRS